MARVAARVVKPAGRPAWQHKAVSGQPTMHGTTAEFEMMSGAHALIRQSGSRVKVAGEKPRGRRG